MDNIFDTLNGFFKDFTSLLFNLFAVGILAEIIFGSFFGVNIIGNIVGVVNKLGNEGFVGIIAILILFLLYKSFYITKTENRKNKFIGEFFWVK